MKRFLYLTVCFFILGKFYGCNGDVFVDDFRSSDSELTLDGNGDVATIQFAAANWDWMYVAFDFPIQYNIYDADNRLITTDQGPSLNGLGKIVCTGEMIDFTIERVHPKEVKITVGENALSAPFQFQLRASNEYEWQEIRVEISPTDRYVMDSITYSLNAYSYNPENRTERKEGVSFHNFTDVFPFRVFLPFYEIQKRCARSFSTTGRSRSDGGNTKHERRIFRDERQAGAVHFCATNVALLQYGAGRRHNSSPDCSNLYLMDGV